MALRRYISPQGAVIIGTLEKLEGCAGIDGIDDETGEVEYTGDTEVYWDSQETVMRGDSRVFIDEDGAEWSFGQLIPDEILDQ